jgi:hypothetical protein
MAENTLEWGQVGAGKTLDGVIQMMDTLEKTERLIVTSCPLIFSLSRSPEDTMILAKALLIQAERKKDKMWRDQCDIYWTVQEYCHQWIKKAVNVRHRTMWINFDQARRFFLYVPTGGRILTPEQMLQSGITMIRNDEDPERECYGYKLPEKEHPLFGWVADFRARGDVDEKDPVCGLLRGGVDYWIDEAHKLFPARQWQKKLSNSDQLEDYMSEVRKCDDNLFLLSQNPEKIDRNARRNMTQWVQVQNMQKTRLLLGVSFNKRFRRMVYCQPEMPNRLDKPTTTTWYHIDGRRRYEYLYRTLHGSSMRGGGVSETKSYKGNHWSVWVVAACVLFYMCLHAPAFVQGIVQHGLGATVGGFGKGVQNAFGYGDKLGAKPAGATPQASPLTGPVGPFNAPPSPPQFVPSVGPFAQAAPQQVRFGTAPTLPSRGGIHVTGVANIGTNMMVYLSDGRVADGANGEIQGVGKRFVRVFGEDPIPW